MQKGIHMTKQEFEEKLQQLTPAEQYFKLHPNMKEKDLEEYQLLMNQVDNDVSEFMGLIKNRVFFVDCNIFPDTPGLANYKSPDIAISRHDRYYDVPEHSHAYIDMNYVFSGNCSVQINDNVIRLVKGDLCLLDCNVNHRVFPTGENDIILNIMLSKQYFINSFYNVLSGGGPISKFLADVMIEKNDLNQYMLFHTAENPMVKELIECMIIEYLFPGICCAAYLYHNLSLLFIELSRCYQIQMVQSPQHKSYQSLTELLDYMEKNCTSCNLTEVAKLFGFHPNYLSRMLKKETGSNFQDIVSEFRMNRAAFLLCHSDIPIYKIANECGYQNQGFFRIKFLEQFGKPPAEYRNESQMGSA